MISFTSRSGTRAFTLIELLVVISIIGFLSSVILASLNQARDKARDSTIKQSLSDMRTTAENQAPAESTDTRFNYATVCDVTTTSGQMFRQAASQSDGTLNSSVCRMPGVLIYTDANGNLQQAAAGTDPAWAAAVKLKTGDYFCTDWTGLATITPTLLVNTYRHTCLGAFDMASSSR